MKELFFILLGGVLVNNYALEQLLGVTPFLGNSRKGAKTVGLGLSVTIVMVLAAAIAWPLQSFVLEPNGLGYLQTLTFAVVIVILAYLLDAAAKKVCKQSLRAFAPAIMLNSAVLGLCLNNAASGYGFLESVAAALGVGLGFLLGMLVMSALNGRIEQHHVPKAFRGLPITLVTASIVSMALYAFR